MKKFWLNSLALSLGLLGYTNASGQYPDNFNSLGASTYQVQGYPEQTIAPQQPMVVQSLPQVPAGYYQQPAQQSVPTQLVAQTYNQQPYQFVSQDGGAIYNQQIVPEQVSAGAGYAPQQVQQLAAPSVAPHVAPQAVPQQYPAAQPYIPPAQQHYAPATSGCQSCEQGGMAAPIDYGYQGGLVSGNVGYGFAPAPTCGTGGCGVGGGYGLGARGGLGIGGLPCGASPWFFGGGVLLFNRIDHKNIPLSFFDADYVANTMTTRDARMGVMPGFQVFGGRYFNCGRNAIQVSYFGIFSDDEVSTDARSTGGDYRSRNPFNYLTIQNPTLTGVYGGPTTGVYDWFDNAFTHQLERSSEFHSLEVNLLGFAAGGSSRAFNSFAGCGAGGHRGGCGGCGSCGGAGCGACGGGCGGGCGSGCGGGCGPVRAPRIGAGPCGLIAPSCGSRCGVTWLGGFRYFRFEDNLTYAASLNDSVISRSNDDLYYDVNTTNDLFGFQMGSRIDYCLGRRVNLYGTAKAGIYGNHSTLYTRVATEFQTATLNDIRTPANPNNGVGYSFRESKDSLAFLGEIGCGLGLRVSSRWTATVGYRALFVDGVATSVGNYRESFANYSDVRDYDNYGNLVLHGLDIGAVYNF
ncbi:MAG: hypothetical protein Aurels2KO_42520 [Aureliella sp.]